MDILRQILNLIVASLPTTIIAFLFFLFARTFFFKPITGVLAERATRTEGAKNEANRLDGQAQERMNMYHRALDKVRAEIYNEQDVARHAALEERAAMLRESRTRSSERVRRAKDGLETQLDAARDQVASETRRLAEDVARAVLAENTSAQISLSDS